MLSKISLVTLILFLVPSLASAGMIYASTPTTSPVRGSISPAGYVSASSPVTFTVTALPGNMIGAVTLNGKQLLPSAPGKYVVPLSATTQKILASFVAEAPSQLTAVLPTTLLAKPGSPLNVYASSSTVILPSGSVATYTWSVSPGATVTPPTGATATSSGLVTTFTSATPGAYTLSLRLSAPGTGLADSSASAIVVVQSQTMANSKVCTDCHQSAPYAAYIMSRHAASNSGPACQDCHNPGLALPHPGTAVVTAAICESCHAATLSTTTHPADITATKCLGCHDSHDPAAGIANLGPAPAHPAVTLYTFEEIGMQMAGGAKVAVQVDANGKGMPYSPKATCGTAGCHVKNGVDYTYDKISDHAFHSSQGRPEYVDSADGKFDATKNKPWGQSTAMVGKW